MERPGHDLYYGKLVGEIASYAALAQSADDGEAWDASKTIDKVLSFLDSIPGSIPMPKPMLLSEQIALYWDFGNAYAEIDFDGSDYIDAYGRRPGVAEVSLNREPITDSDGRVFFPAKLERVISSFEDTVAT
jgi:hypothetical protein